MDGASSWAFAVSYRTFGRTLYITVVLISHKVRHQGPDEKGKAGFRLFIDTPLVTKTAAVTASIRCWFMPHHAGVSALGSVTTPFYDAIRPWCVRLWMGAREDDEADGAPLVSVRSLRAAGRWRSSLLRRPSGPIDSCLMTGTDRSRYALGSPGYALRSSRRS